MLDLPARDPGTTIHGGGYRNGPAEFGFVSIGCFGEQGGALPRGRSSGSAARDGATTERQRPHCLREVARHEETAGFV